jgi:hypothetical protein
MIDGALPGNPMADAGLYDPCDPWVPYSRFAGGVAREAALAIPAVGVAGAAMKAAGKGAYWANQSKGVQYFAGSQVPGLLMKGHGWYGNAGAYAWWTTAYGSKADFGIQAGDLFLFPMFRGP